MSTLSPNEIAGAARAAGFRGRALVIAVAVALAESSGDPTATNHNTNGTTDYGLWQINSVHAGILRQGSWSDPTDNARMAYAVSNGGRNWVPWTTFNDGAYLAHMPAATVAAGNPLPPGSVPQPTSGVTPVDFGSTMGALSNFGSLASLLLNPFTYIRLAMFGVGFGLVVMGLVHVSGTARTIAQTGKSMAKDAAVAAVLAPK